MNEADVPLITWDDIRTGLLHYFITSLIVLLGVGFGREFLDGPMHSNPLSGDFLDCLARFDGQHYRRSCVEGYSYDPNQRSPVAFFPAYPLLARWLMQILPCRTEAALLLVAHVFLAGAFVLLSAYCRQRFGREAPQIVDSILLSFGLFPTTLFFRMAYSESVFVTLTLLVLLGIERRWPLWLIASLVGLATGTRPVGVALVAVFLLHLWNCSPNAKRFLVSCLSLLPLSCWGLLAYVAFQFIAFDEPLAFAKTQDHWRLHAPAPSVAAKVESLLSLEPITGIFSPSSPRYWRYLDPDGDPFFSLVIANPILFVVSGLVVVFGALRRWLTRFEIVLSIGLLLIPYVTRGYDNSMASSGRFVAIIVPCHICVGRLTCDWPLPAKVSLAALTACYLGAFAGLYAVGHSIY
jgi:hypothetical protein